LDEVVELSAEIVLVTVPMNGAVVDEVELPAEIVPVTVPTNGEIVGETDVTDEEVTTLVIEVLTELVELVVTSGCPKFVEVDGGFSHEAKSLKFDSGANGSIVDNGASMVEVIARLDPGNDVDVLIVVGDGVPTTGLVSNAGSNVCDACPNALDVTILEISSDSVRVNNKVG
jgi:hypothetical protein